MTLLPGTLLGPYELISQIGAGGMGEVYRARDPRLGREVAIKVLAKSFARDPDRLRRFEQEARSTGALNHPNILAIHDLGTHEGAPYLVTELLEGETLKDRLRTAPIPQRKAIEFALQTASGLAAAHDKGIIHRDLKPDNLFVTREGRVKILDFGLAKLLGPEGNPADPTSAMTSAGHTVPGVVLGTVGYMSPEQVRGLPVDQRSDIFSFGTILFEMLAGQRAFERDSAVETMNAILKEDPPEVDSARVLLPPGLERIVARCLEKQPEDRFRSAHDLAFALEALSGVSSMTSPTEILPIPEGLAAGRGARGSGPHSAVRDGGAGLEREGAGAARRPAGRARMILMFVWGALVVALLAFVIGRMTNPAVKAAPQLATLVVRTTPARARVSLDDKTLRGPAATFDSLAAGAYTLRVEMEGYVAATRDVTIEPGIAREESVALMAAEAPARPAARAPARDRSGATTGSLHVFAGTQQLRVVLDGKETNRSTPCVLTGLAPGAHTVAVKGGKAGADARGVSVVAGDTVDINLLPRDGAKRGTR